jgi:hypothetical protein
MAPFIQVDPSSSSFIHWINVPSRTSRIQVFFSNSLSTSIGQDTQH